MELLFLYVFLSIVGITAIIYALFTRKQKHPSK